jgi:hypothetical protein
MTDNKEFYTPSGALRVGQCPCGAGMDKVISDSSAQCTSGHFYEIQGPDWGQPAAGCMAQAGQEIAELKLLVKGKQARIEELEKVLATVMNVLGDNPRYAVEAYVYNSRLLRDVQTSKPGDSMNLLQGTEAETLLLKAMDRQWDKLTDEDKTYLKAARLDGLKPRDRAEPKEDPGVQGAPIVEKWDVLESRDVPGLTFTPKRTVITRTPPKLWGPVPSRPVAGPYICTVCNELFIRLSRVLP